MRPAAPAPLPRPRSNRGSSFWRTQTHRRQEAARSALSEGEPRAPAAAASPCSPLLTSPGQMPCAWNPPCPQGILSLPRHRGSELWSRRARQAPFSSAQVLQTQGATVSSVARAIANGQQPRGMPGAWALEPDRAIACQQVAQFLILCELLFPGRARWTLCLARLMTRHPARTALGTARAHRALTSTGRSSPPPLHTDPQSVSRDNIQRVPRHYTQEQPQ